MEPPRTFFDDCAITSNSRVVPLPLNVICGNQAFNENTKQEFFEHQVLYGTIKGVVMEETEEEKDHHNENQLLQKGVTPNSSRVVPLPLNVICGNQAFNENTKQEFVEHQVLYGTIKEEVMEETEEEADHHDENKLLQKGCELNLCHSI